MPIGMTDDEYNDPCCGCDANDGDCVTCDASQSVVVEE
jgi:hypothetical protein